MKRSGFDSQVNNSTPANSRELTHGMPLPATLCEIARKSTLLQISAPFLGSILACQGSGSATPKVEEAPPPLTRTAIPTNLHTRLVENSIAVTSVTQPGIIFGVNDSGHEAILYAFDSTGTSRGIWRVNGARNLDWEAAATGPCAGKTGTFDCIYIGDVGDNEARKPTVTIYRVTEPKVDAGPSDQRKSPTASTSRAQVLTIQYPDSPHDVEAMYVTAAGDLFIITKRRLLNVERNPRQALMYRVPASAWSSSATATAALVDSLPLVPGDMPGRQVTDAALSPDGTQLAIRTYAEVYIFAVDATTGRPSSGTAPSVCTILDLNENQGEGIGWWWDRKRLLLTSEGTNEPLHVIECPSPSG
jgi:hypothetical protein